jgi:steroid delta-isomerase-like uncharacterized protein
LLSENASRYRVLSPAGRKRRKMMEENKQVVLGCWESANRKDASGFDEYYDEDVVHYTTAGEIRGRENVKAYLLGYLTAFPDLKVTVEDIFGEGDRVFSRARMEGTNTGQLMGMPPTGKRIDIRWMMNVCRVQNGKIVEEWEIVDTLEIMRQLGVIDVPTPAPTA